MWFQDANGPSVWRSRNWRPGWKSAKSATHRDLNGPRNGARKATRKPSMPNVPLTDLDVDPLPRRLQPLKRERAACQAYNSSADTGIGERRVNVATRDMIKPV